MRILFTLISILICFSSPTTHPACCLTYYASYQVKGSSTGISSIALSPDGLYLAAANWNPPQSSDAIIFNLTGSNSTQTAYPLPHGSQGPNTPLGIAFSPDGSYLVTANDSNDLTVFNVSPNGILSGATSYLIGSGCCSTLVFSPDGTHIAIPNNYENSIMICSITAGVIGSPTSYSLPSSSSGPEAIAFSYDGKYLATCNDSNDVTVFSVTNGVLSNGKSYAIPSSPDFSTPNALAFSPDGSLLVVANEGIVSYTGKGNITVFNVSSGILSNGTNYSMPSGAQGPSNIAFSPDGTCLVVANGADVHSSDNLTTFTVASGALGEGTSFNIPAGYPAFFIDGTYLATTAGPQVVLSAVSSETQCASGSTTTTTTAPTAGTSAHTSMSSKSSRLQGFVPHLAQCLKALDF